MESRRFLGREIAVFILGINSALSFAFSGPPRPLEQSVEVKAFGALKNIVGQSGTLLPDGITLVAGGTGSTGPVKTAFLEDSGTGAQISTSGLLQHGRAFHTATLLPNGRVLIFGGIGADNSVLTEAEIFDPAKQTFIAAGLTGLTPRAHHSATLLTDGRLMIAGGVDGNGNTLSQIELWDFRSGHVSTLEVSLITPRRDQTAALLPDGSVLLWGGEDGNGAPLHDGEIIDPNGPSIRLVSRPKANPQDASPYMAGSIPQSGETGVATDQILALRFSKPLLVATLNSDTVSLRSSTGSLTANVIPAEGGILAFITPKEPLDTQTAYTVSISGAKDTIGHSLPDAVVIFTTAQTAEAIPGAAESIVSGVGAQSEQVPADAAPSTGGFRMPSDPRQLPVLKAADGITALAGQVLTLDRAPLPNVRIELDSRFAVTDNTGRFIVENVGSGHHVMIIDGSTANTKSISYGLYRVGVDLKAARTNSLNYTVWMAALDTEHEVPISSPTASETVVTNPTVPGLELHIPAGTIIRDARGKVVTRIGITGIPVNQPPFPLKQGIRYPVYFTIQPGGATFETQNGANALSGSTQRLGVTIHYQNYLNARPGARFPFWSYDPERRGWHIYGHGRVGADAKDIAPEEGTELLNFDGAMVSLPSNGDPNGPNPCLGAAPAPCNANPGDPVDLETGLFVYRKTDLFLNDVIPLALSRAYRPNDSNSRAFGIGTSMSFDDFMTGDDNDTPEGYTYQDLNLEDGGKVHFTRTSPCLGANGYCDFTNALFEATSAPGRFYGATLQFVESGGAALGMTSGDYWQITTKDGTIYAFPDSDNSSNPRSAAMQVMQDRYGNSLRFVRDNNWNLTQIVSPNGRSIQFTYDSNNRIVQAQDNAGRTVSYTYNSAGYLETVTDANGGVTKYVYDDNGNMLNVEDARGIVYIQNQYDSNGMVTKQTMADGSTYLFSYALDSYGNVSQGTVTDPRGNVEQVTFDSDGFMSTDTHAVEKAEQQTITYNRQPGTGLLLSMTDPLNRTTSYTYDAMANVTSMTQLSGTASPITTTYGYDQRFFEVSDITDPLGNTASLTYDSFGNMVSATDPLGNSSTFTYNAAGQPTTVTDPLGNQTQFGYDSGSLVSITDPLGRESTRSVDNAGRVVSVSDPLNDVVSIAYDPLNEITSVTDPMGSQTVFTYDGNGDRVTVTDANEHTTTYTYDNMDRVVNRRDPLGNQDSFQYDGNGNLTQVTDRKGQVTTIQYDGLNRPTVAQYNDGSSVTKTFDAGNRLTGIADSQSGTISRSYDGLNDLLSETTPQGSVAYTYDADRRRQTMTASGQLQVSYSFDNAGRLTSITQGTAAVSFVYDNDSRRTALMLPNGIAANYNYDAASQLMGIAYQGGALAPANLEYTYDLAGRRTSVSGSLASTQLPPAISSAAYNANNQLTQWGATTMTYDANGNTLNDGMNNYAWDARNRLVSANSNGATFAYDSLGRRISKNILTASTSFLYDGVNPVQELNGTTVTANLLTGGIDERFTRTDSTGTSDYLTDALGSTVALTDGSGNSQVQYSYSPFGGVDITGPTNNTYTYTGREIDGLGINYFRARYYNPTTGRFLSEDPLGFRAGINKYIYVDDDPILFKDPRGTSLCPVHYYETFLAFIQVYGIGNIDAAAAAGLSVCSEDIGTQGTSFMDTRRHAMGGRKDNGNPQNCYQAYESTVNFVNTTDDPMAAIHAIQDSYASGHQYQLWPGGLPSLAHVAGDSVYLPSAETATADYLQDLKDNDLQDASAYLAPLPCS